jgi:hypothetical protein
MKPRNRFASYVLGAMLISLAVLGVYTANQTYQYEIIVKGTLGLALLYFQFFYIRFSGADASMDGMLSDPKIHRYLIYAFIGPGIAYWAVIGILDMILLIAGKLAQLLK